MHVGGWSVNTMKINGGKPLARCAGREGEVTGPFGVRFSNTLSGGDEATFSVWGSAEDWAALAVELMHDDPRIAAALFNDPRLKEEHLAWELGVGGAE